ncbi:MAG TPA: hypothetical protein VL172_17640 [Kofleriaceae bacterium]|nr:hypothetical protein [Kofleriaceae bacterium]
MVGEIEPVGAPGDGDGDGADAGDPADGGGADGTPTGDPTPDPGCLPIAAPNGSGHHNAGQDCMNCHAAGGEGPLFTLGGTLFSSVGGTAPVAGATITVHPATGADLALITASNGNFWSTQALTFPLTVGANGCPSVRTMPNPVAADGAGCNGAGCHDAGSRIHLP